MAATRRFGGHGFVASVLAGLAGAGSYLAAQAPPSSASCVITGTATSAGTPLPGVSIVLTRDGVVAGVTSTDQTGAYRVRVAPGTYTATAQLAGFAETQEAIVVTEDGPTCAMTRAVHLTLASRVPAATPTAVEPTQPGNTPSSTEPSATAQTGSAGERLTFSRRPPRIGDSATGAAAQGGRGFAALRVQQAQEAGAAPAAAEIDEQDPAARLLPPGFSTSGGTDVVAVTGSAATVDRGQLRDRFDALGRGEFAAGGADAPFGAAGGAPGPFAGPGGFGGGPGGPGFAPGQGGRGGIPPGGVAGGRGGFLGRGRGTRLQGSTTYTFGGSALDAMPYPVRAGGQTAPDYTRQQFGGQLGGPLKIPGVSDGARTTFFLSYGGARSNSLLDQYATVPTAALRGGDFSGRIAPVDPLTGQPFPDGVIPADRIDPAARALLDYFPLPNLPGIAQNYRRIAAAATVSDNVSLRLTHSFTGAAVRGQGGRGGRGRAGPAGTAVVLNAQVQYQYGTADSLNVFPALGGQTTNTSFSAPLALNVLHGRTIHNIRVTAAHTSSAAQNRFSGVTDVAGDAGIEGVSTNPFDWGVPALSFAGISSLRDITPTRRADTRVQADYTFTRPLRQHTLRFGAGIRHDVSDGWTVSEARGSFVFSGLYSADDPLVPRGSGLDFADFLLGLPQQALVGFGPGDAILGGRAVNLFAQDDWRARSNLTFNLGVRYEVVRPFTEANGHMTNLDVAPGFTDAVPVVSGGTGPFTGPFPAALVNADMNNVGPRLGVAWRAAPRTVVRGGYGIGFNNGAYASIARQLVGQPPFAVTNTSVGTIADPLSLGNAFTTTTAETTNNYGVDRNYQLGAIQTWNVDIQQTLRGSWQLAGGYTGTRGSHLDILRAPNRDPDGLRIDGVQPFLWQSSEGHSVLHAATVRVRKRQTHGVSGAASYTLAKSMDNASSIGGGGQVVAQNDQDLAAEWGLSSFDRRHLFESNVSVELPFGGDHRWLNQGGPWAAAFANWSLAASFTAQSGTPYTARVLAAASDAVRGTSGTLRADYLGDPIALDPPSLNRFFNTRAFAVPAANAFGTAGRNTIIGPSQSQLDAALTRDIRLTSTQVLSLRVEATNVLNSVRFGTIDTAVNSPTFGQVMSIRPMRTVQVNARYRF